MCIRDRANNLTDKDKKVKIRKRNWAFVAYPESLPGDWQEILTQTGLPIAISPLHDKDENPDGTKKKPHYHVILVYLDVYKRQISDRLRSR